MTCTQPTPYSIGAAKQAPIPAAVHNIPGSIAASGAVMSTLIAVQGYNQIAFGFTSSQAGVVTIQRYLDSSGMTAQGAPITQNFTAGAAVSVNVTDNLPFASFQVIISNTGNATAYLTNLVLLVKAANADENGSVASPMRVSDVPLETATGSPTDSAYAGGASATIVGALKGLYQLGKSFFGSLGADHSVNEPTWPLDTNNWTLLATVPANSVRASIEVQNQSGVTIHVYRDDGVDTAATRSLILLGDGGAGQQGGSWASRTFKGRVRIYAAAGTSPVPQVSVFED